MLFLAVLPQAIRFDSADSTNIARNHCRTKGQPGHVAAMAKKIKAGVEAVPRVLGRTYVTDNFDLPTDARNACHCKESLLMCGPNEGADMTKVVIVDCEKAGLIGGPFAVWVVKDGKRIASTSGIQGPTGANGVARNYGFAYRVADVPQLPVAA